MLRCSVEAFARCPTRHLCERREDTIFIEGSECDLFNQQVAAKPMTNGDRIRAINDYELAVLFAKTKAMLYRLDLSVIAYSAKKWLKIWTGSSLLRRIKMGVMYESQVWAGCDNCGTWEATSTMKVADFKKYLRKKGWRIGMICLCPECAIANPDKGVTYNGE